MFATLCVARQIACVKPRDISRGLETRIIAKECQFLGLVCSGRRDTLAVDERKRNGACWCGLTNRRLTKATPCKEEEDDHGCYAVCDQEKAAGAVIGYGK